MLLLYIVKIHRQLISVFFTIFQVVNLQKFTNKNVKICNNLYKNSKVFINCADIYSTKGKQSKKIKKGNFQEKEKENGIERIDSNRF